MAPVELGDSRPRINRRARIRNGSAKAGLKGPVLSASGGKANGQAVLAPVQRLYEIEKSIGRGKLEGADAQLLRQDLAVHRGRERIVGVLSALTWKTHAHTPTQVIEVARRLVEVGDRDLSRLAFNLVAPLGMEGVPLLSELLASAATPPLLARDVVRHLLVIDHAPGVPEVNAARRAVRATRED